MEDDAAPVDVWNEIRIWQAWDAAIKSGQNEHREAKTERLTIVAFGKHYLNQQPGGKQGSAMKILLSKDFRKQWQDLGIKMETEGQYQYRQFSFPRLVNGQPFQIPAKIYSLSTRQPFRVTSPFQVCTGGYSHRYVK
jgi:hypothetical protein